MQVNLAMWCACSMVVRRHFCLFVGLTKPKSSLDLQSHFPKNDIITELLRCFYWARAGLSDREQEQMLLLPKCASILFLYNCVISRGNCENPHLQFPWVWLHRSRNQGHGRWEASDGDLLVIQARGHGGHLGAVLPKYFLCPPNFVVPRKICFKHIIKTKILHP